VGPATPPWPKAGRHEVSAKMLKSRLAPGPAPCRPPRKFLSIIFMGIFSIHEGFYLVTNNCV